MLWEEVPSGKLCGDYGEEFGLRPRGQGYVYGDMLLDVHLADGDGKGISDVMSESDDLQVTKIIAMSSKLTDGQVAQLRHQGFDGALRKPFTVRQVIEAIEGAHAVVY